MSQHGNPPNWLSWFAVALPVALVCLLVLWRFILLVYRIDSSHQASPPTPPLFPSHRASPALSALPPTSRADSPSRLP
eukprot:364063-Prorocentrum_minimum.AAC.2